LLLEDHVSLWVVNAQAALRAVKERLNVIEILRREHLVLLETIVFNGTTVIDKHADIPEVMRVVQALRGLLWHVVFIYWHIVGNEERLQHPDK
jgi:hypothetical protein